MPIVKDESVAELPVYSDYLATPINPTEWETVYSITTPTSWSNGITETSRWSKTVTKTIGKLLIKKVRLYCRFCDGASGVTSYIALYIGGTKRVEHAVTGDLYADRDGEWGYIKTESEDYEIKSRKSTAGTTSVAWLYVYHKQVQGKVRAI